MSFASIVLDIGKITMMSVTSIRPWNILLETWPIFTFIFLHISFKQKHCVLSDCRIRSSQYSCRQTPRWRLAQERRDSFPQCADALSPKSTSSSKGRLLQDQPTGEDRHCGEDRVRYVGQHARTHTYARTHARTRVRTHTHTHTHTRTHTHTPTHTCLHTHTHAHRHTYINTWRFLLYT